MPSFVQALRFWWLLGLTSFGGPAGQIAIMHDELVSRRGWVSEAKFQHALSYCLLLPGPEAQQLATYLGWLMHGTRGAIAAGLLFVLPALLLMLLLAWVYMRWGNLPWVAATLWGLKPVVVGLVLQAAYRMAKRSLTSARLWLMFLACLAASGGLDMGFPWVLLMAAIMAYLLLPVTAVQSVVRPATASVRSLLLSSARTAALWLAIWLVPVAVLAWYFGDTHIFTQMAQFFSQAAVLTFGGAYAVLPYVFDSAVNQFAWVSTEQIMDALALGETTPGPLVLVLSFVAYVGAYAQAASDSAAWMGFAAGMLVAWVTFAPSFLFILVGGPWIERSYGTQAWQRPLQGVMVAVLAFIVLLAVAFALHIARPEGVADGGWDIPAVTLALVSAWLLITRGWSVPRVLSLGLLAGLLRTALA